MPAMKNKVKELQKTLNDERKVSKDKIKGLLHALKRKEKRILELKREIVSLSNTVQFQTNCMLKTFDQERSWVTISQNPDRAIASLESSVSLIQSFTKMNLRKYEEKI